MTHRLPSNTREYLRKVNRKAINRLIFFLFWLSIVGVPISVSRGLFTGWQPLFSIHVFDLITISFLYLFHRWLATELKIWVIFAISFMSGALGLLVFGILGGVVSWLIFSVLILFFFVGSRPALYAGLVIFILYLFCAYSFIYRKQIIPGGLDVQIYSITAWLTVMLGAAKCIVLGYMVAEANVKKIERLRKGYSVQKKAMRDIQVKVTQQQMEIAHHQNHDTLTGLATLTLANERLDMAISLAKRNSEKVALLYFDLDGFKTINEKHGYDAGDELLTVSAARIKNTIRESDTACRIGGDEFLVILSCVSRVEDIEMLCSRIIEKLSAPIKYEYADLQAQVNIGVAIFPDHETEPRLLHSLAHQAMSEAKNSGSNRYCMANAG